MKVSIIIPVYNEEEFVGITIDSLLNQTLPIYELILVDDNSSDGTWEILSAYALANSNIKIIKATKAPSEHLPGSKVVRAFANGLPLIKSETDVICKFDSDLIFPSNYVETMVDAFSKNKQLGIFGGICSIEVNGSFVPELVADKDHVRGALKAYRKKCFDDMGGLREAMGWDSVDELLAQYYGWEVEADYRLVVKHLRVTGASYKPAAQRLKGEAFYKMGYGFALSTIASLKMAMSKGKLSLFGYYMSGYFKSVFSDVKRVVTKDEAKFIRKLRWRRIKAKIGNGS